MNKKDWKYLMNELFLHYRADYLKEFIGTNKTSIYRWLKGETYPRFARHQNKVLELAQKHGGQENLLQAAKLKELQMIKMVHSPKILMQNDKIVINTLPIMNEEMDRRNTLSANKWFIQNIGDKYISIKYVSNYRERHVKIPIQINFSEDMSQIIGFWLGDGTTKKIKGTAQRSYITLTNENLSVFKHLAELFELHRDNFDIEIIYGKNVNLSRLKHFEKRIKQLNIKYSIRKHGNWNSLGACFHIRNAPLSYIFNFVKKNIHVILQKSSRKIINAFLGGYFTAEGSVSKINQFFEFNETKIIRRKIIINMLKKQGFLPIREYKEKIILCYNLQNQKQQFSLFSEIIPYIFSTEKKRSANELVNGFNMRKIDIIYFFFYLFIQVQQQAFCHLLF